MTTASTKTQVQSPKRPLHQSPAIQPIPQANKHIWNPVNSHWNHENDVEMYFLRLNTNVKNGTIATIVLILFYRD